MEISKELLGQVIRYIDLQGNVVKPKFYNALLKLKDTDPEGTLEERKEAFRTELASLTQDEEGNWVEPYTEAQIKKFWNHWTEISPKGRKYRFEKQDTFDMKRRLATWLRMSKSFSIAGMLKSKNNMGNK